VTLSQVGRFDERRTKDATPQTHPQQLAFFELPLDNAVPRLVRWVKPHGKRYLQDCLWRESLLAVKVSLECQSVAELIPRLRECLPQNSVETRERNTSIILSRFFPTMEIDQLPRRVLRTYSDESLLAAVMRVLFLEAEPLVGHLVAERLFPLPPGTALAKGFFSSYAEEASGKKDKHLVSRCKAATRALGWVIEEKRTSYVAQQTAHETAALLIFHYYCAIEFEGGMRQKNTVKQKRISELKSYEEMAEFWDTHSLVDYWEETEPAEFAVSERARHYLRRGESHATTRSSRSGDSPRTNRKTERG